MTKKDGRRKSGDPRRRGGRPRPPRIGERPGEEGWDERMVALARLIEHTGAVDFQVRYQDDMAPTVWVAVAGYIKTDHSGREGTAYLVGAGLNPMSAAYKLAENVMDGGMCKSCGKPTGVVMDFEPMPLEDLVCWFRYNPVTKGFAPGCQTLAQGSMN